MKNIISKIRTFIYGIHNRLWTYDIPDITVDLATKLIKSAQTSYSLQLHLSILNKDKKWEIVQYPKVGDLVYESSAWGKWHSEPLDCIGWLIAIEGGSNFRIKTIDGRLLHWHNADFHKVLLEVPGEERKSKLVLE